MLANMKAGWERPSQKSYSH